MKTRKRIEVAAERLSYIAQHTANRLHSGSHFCSPRPVSSAEFHIISTPPPQIFTTWFQSNIADEKLQLYYADIRRLTFSSDADNVRLANVCIIIVAMLGKFPVCYKAVVMMSHARAFLTVKKYCLHPSLLTVAQLVTITIFRKPLKNCFFLFLPTTTHLFLSQL